jgi:prepilin-type N-terminal cleavage/methylation domain-containing protein
MKRTRGFTLLEIIVALGVLAVGATAAFSLLVAAASAGRRAEHEVNAALIADSRIADLKADLSVDLDLSDLPTAAQVLEERQAAGRLAATPPLTPDPATRYVEHDATWDAYPDYTFDVALTPLPGPVPDQPWEYLVEVEVRWSEQGQRRSASFASVLVRGLTHADNPQPGSRRRRP